MELIGLLTFGEGEYRVYNEQEGWACPFVVGDRAEVLLGGQWQAVSMKSNGCGGHYLRLADGRWLRPALRMQVRIAKM